MSIELTPVLEERLEVLAAQTHRSAQELAQEGMEHFLAYEEDMVATVKRGREDFAAGRTVSHEEVLLRLAKILEAK